MLNQVNDMPVPHAIHMLIIIVIVKVHPFHLLIGLKINNLSYSRCLPTADYSL